MAGTANQIHFKTTNEIRNVAVNFTELLDSGEKLTGTPSVSVSPSGITVSNVARNSTTATILGESVPANQAITFTASGGTSGTQYTLTVQVDTDASNAQTLEGKVRIRVE